jgi:hypothetical protein
LFESVSVEGGSTFRFFVGTEDGGVGTSGITDFAAISGFETGSLSINDS